MPTESVPTTSTGAISLPARTPPPTQRARGIIAQLTSSLVSQSGATVAAVAIDAIGAAPVVAVRQVVAAAVLIPLARPPIRRLNRRTLGTVALLGIATLTMNLGLYTAIGRIGLALAVTLEFLGPLAVALNGARHVKDYVAAVAALGGVIVLVGPTASNDWLGIGSALMAAVSWACYILLNRRIGSVLPGMQGAALSAATGAIVAVPALVLLSATVPLTCSGLMAAAAAGVLCSVVPMAADLYALRRIPARLFGVMASINPVAAAAAAAVVLHQVPTLLEVVGIGLIVAANITATLEFAPRDRNRS